MAHPPKTDTKQRAREQRRARLVAELRSNLRKRKAQARGGALPGAPGMEYEGLEYEGLEYEGSDYGNEQPDAREAATRPTGEVA